MQVPLEITFRGLDKVNETKLEQVIREKVLKLEKVCDHIISCRVAVEQNHKHHNTGNPYRIRIDLNVPPGHEIVVNKEYQFDDATLYGDLRDAFEAARRSLRRLIERQRNDVKSHSRPSPTLEMEEQPDF